jgi:hypothetical protein
MFFIFVTRFLAKPLNASFFPEANAFAEPWWGKAALNLVIIFENLLPSSRVLRHIFGFGRIFCPLSSIQSSKVTADVRLSGSRVRTGDRGSPFQRSLHTFLEDGDSKYLRNVSTYLLNYTASNLK